MEERASTAVYEGQQQQARQRAGTGGTGSANSMASIDSTASTPSIPRTQKPASPASPKPQPQQDQPHDQNHQVQSTPVTVYASGWFAYIRSLLLSHGFLLILISGYGVTERGAEGGGGYAHAGSQPSMNYDYTPSGAGILPFREKRLSTRRTWVGRVGRCLSYTTHFALRVGVVS